MNKMQSEQSETIEAFRTFVCFARTIFHFIRLSQYLVRTSQSRQFSNVLKIKDRSIKSSSPIFDLTKCTKYLNIRLFFNYIIFQATANVLRISYIQISKHTITQLFVVLCNVYFISKTTFVLYIIRMVII